MLDGFTKLPPTLGSLFCGRRAFRADGVPSAAAHATYHEPAALYKLARHPGAQGRARCTGGYTIHKCRGGGLGAEVDLGKAPDIKIKRKNNMERIVEGACHFRM